MQSNGCNLKWFKAAVNTCLTLILFILGEINHLWEENSCRLLTYFSTKINSHSLKNLWKGELPLVLSDAPWSEGLTLAAHSNSSHSVQRILPRAIFNAESSICPKSDFKIYGHYYSLLIKYRIIDSGVKIIFVQSLCVRHLYHMCGCMLSQMSVLILSFVSKHNNFYIGRSIAIHSLGSQLEL